MSNWCVVCLPPGGEPDWLVPSAQEHGPTDDIQGEGRPWEAEKRSVQPSHDLCAADTQQGDISRFNTQDGVRCLHLPQQVTNDSCSPVLSSNQHARLISVVVCCCRSETVFIQCSQSWNNNLHRDITTFAEVTGHPCVTESQWTVVFLCSSVKVLHERPCAGQ